MSSIEDRVTPDTLTAARDTGVGLIADIGATNARFALVLPGGKITPARVCALDDYPSLADALDAYLAEQAPAARPIEAVLAIASPVTGDEITLTNHAWTFSVAELRRHLTLKRLRVINDFAANAAAIPFLGDDDRIQIGDGTPADGAPVGIIGPGTGLGVGALAPAPGGAVTIAAEGGHVTMAPATAQESTSSISCASATIMSRPSGCCRAPDWSICTTRCANSPARRRHRTRPTRSRARAPALPIRAPARRPRYFAPCSERWPAISL
jgi:hypothetical protein